MGTCMLRQLCEWAVAQRVAVMYQQLRATIRFCYYGQSSKSQLMGTVLHVQEPGTSAEAVQWQQDPALAATLLRSRLEVGYKPLRAV